MSAVRRAALLAVLLAVRLPAQGSACAGEERWDVKVMRDSLARMVDRSNAVPTTIGALVSLPAPREAASEQRHGLERRVYRVRARIVDRRGPQADGDVHLILADPARPSVTMIAEIPDSACARGSRFASDFAEARRLLDATSLDLEFEVEGVGFFDRDHGQVGAAPNGIELHPVLRLAPVYTKSDLLQDESEVPPQDPADVRVWANTASRVYHCPGSAYYGTTARGAYMLESEATKAGYRPAGGRRCR